MASAATSRRSPRQDAGRSLEDYLRAKAPGNWIVNRTDNGEVSSFMGGLIPDAGRNAAAALGLAREIAPVLGIDPSQLQPRAGTDPTPLSTAWRFIQVYEGFEVWDGAFSLHSRNTDGAVFIVNTSLKPVEKVNLSPPLSVTDAQRIVETRYSGRSVKVTLYRPGRVVWTESPRPELAWVFIAEVAKPEFDRIEVVVGAESSKILAEASALAH